MQRVNTSILFLLSISCLYIQASTQTENKSNYTLHNYVLPYNNVISFVDKGTSLYRTVNFTSSVIHQVYFMPILVRRYLWYVYLWE